MKKILFLMISCVLLVPFNNTAFAQSKFTDIEASYAKKQILSLTQLGIITGYDETTFQPKKSISRVEFAAILARGLELTVDPSGANQFQDVPQWAKGYVGALVNAGYVHGISETSFGPNLPITREQMTAMLIRATNLEEYVTALTLPNIFQDEGKISSWAKPHVAFATKIGLINGDGTNFYPKDNAERQAAAKLVYSFAIEPDQLIFNSFDVILSENGVENIEEIIFINEGLVKAITAFREVIFFNTDTGDLFTTYSFDAPATDWPLMDNTQKQSYMSTLIAHWYHTGEMSIDVNNIDYGAIRTAIDNYFAQGGATDLYLYEIVRYILEVEGFAVFT